MTRTKPTPQESRTDRVTLTVTPAEWRAIKAVAAARETDVSNLLRTMLLEDILAEFERIRAVVRESV